MQKSEAHLQHFLTPTHDLGEIYDGYRLWRVVSPYGIKITEAIVHGFASYYPIIGIDDDDDDVAD